MKEYQVFQTQHRLKFDEEFRQRQKDGWELFGPVQFQVFPERQNNNTYYLATFVRETYEKLDKRTHISEVPPAFLPPVEED